MREASPRPDRPFGGLAWGLSLLLLALDAPAAPRESKLASEPGVVRVLGVDVGDQDVGQPSCDVNGDGILDLIVAAGGADGIENSRPTAGEVYVFYGRRGSWTGSLDPATEADVRIIGQEEFDNLGSGVVCGDLNGDGYDDVVVCAFNAHGPGNSRFQSGQAHLILGGPSVPTVIDLATDPAIVIYGAESGDIMCSNPALGDVNGDGRLDLILDATGAYDVPRTVTHAGRVHVILGRDDWPPVVDLATASDVRIHGSVGTALFDNGDTLGSNLAAGDLDGDGIDELIAGARLGDGPGDSRHNAGEVHLFRGRSSWPAAIDLRVQTADTYVIGADPSDNTASRGRSLLVADLDIDARPELIVGASEGDGPGNVGNGQGEVRRVAFGAMLPPTIDLATDGESTWYGADALDAVGINLSVGEVNGDAIEDLVFGVYNADGITNSESEAGEIAVVYGRPGLLGNFDFGAGDADLVLYGSAEDRGAFTRALSDVNGDGIMEMVISTSTDPFLEKRATVWIVSPVDTDGDGLRNLPDNCPLVWNPDQRDSDGDLVGDACDPDLVNTIGDMDGDGIADAQDNCPHHPNPLQADSDGDAAGDLCDNCPGLYNPGQADRDHDGAGDLCDCEPDDPNDATPREVAWLDAERVGGSGVRLDWRPAEGAKSYSITRSDLDALAPGAYGSCLTNGVFETTYDDAEIPAPGKGFAYLVQAQSFECGLGSLGAASGESPRANGSSGACTGGAFSDVNASAEQSVFGTVIGALADTYTSNDVAQTIRESLSSGSPSSRFSRLEHRWRFEVPAGRRVELHVEGWRTRSTDGDAFRFELSTDGGTTWSPVSLPTLWIADRDVDRVVALPASLAGTVWVRVVDTDRTAGNQALDEVSFDRLFVRSVP